MYEMEVTVTTYTPEELKLTADWPLIWLQAPGAIEILRKLFRAKSCHPSTSLLSDQQPQEIKNSGASFEPWPNWSRPRGRKQVLPRYFK